MRSRSVDPNAKAMKTLKVANSYTHGSQNFIQEEQDDQPDSTTYSVNLDIAGQIGLGKLPEATLKKKKKRMATIQYDGDSKTRSSGAYASMTGPAKSRALPKIQGSASTARLQGQKVSRMQ